MVALAFVAGLATAPSVQRPATAAPADQPGEKSQRIKALREARLEALKDANLTRPIEYFAGRITVETVYFYSREVLEAEVDLTTNRADRRAAYQAHRDRMAAILKKNKDRFDAGRISRQDYQVSRAFVLEADLWLEQGAHR
jgi:hypothetical protein